MNNIIVDKILPKGSKRRELIKKIMNKQPEQSSKNVINKNDDRFCEFQKIKLLAKLLKEHGVKHIVLSPGGKDVPLVRVFENNDDIFILHRVTDERSAAYYALGIAAETKSLVACVCTRGTAVANYLPAITEAYYTGVPIVAITADGYNIFHGHGEDQTIEQDGIFRRAVKKSITIPEGNDYKALHQAKRDISYCLAEATHNSFGPVHINFAIGDINYGENFPKSEWKISSEPIKTISFVSLSDDKMPKYVSQLKKAEKILIICGQNLELTNEEKENIKAFAQRYNCVILTDHISNLHNEYCLSPYQSIFSINQIDFNKCLSPDILITIGGKRLMVDPITFKIRGGLKTIEHWHINPSGKVRDFYFTMQKVFEMSQNAFFRYFSSQAGESKNNMKYYNQWKDKTITPSPTINVYNSTYIQSIFFPLVPKDSILHLGVGKVFIECRKFHIDPTVKVYCNMGTNGIDGCTSTFLGAASCTDKMCYLIVGDLSFFYDMNSIWNKFPKKNVRILLINNKGSGLLRVHNLKGIAASHNTSAKGWVESNNFKYMSASTKEEFDAKIKSFVLDESDQALFFEVFCN